MHVIYWMAMAQCDPNECIKGNQKKIGSGKKSQMVRNQKIYDENM